MSITKFLETSPLNDIIIYDQQKDYEKNCVCFEGNPRKHPYDEERIILILDPINRNTVFHEFRKKDIQHMEEMASLASSGGESMRQVRIWVIKGSWGLKYEPIKIE